VQIDLLALCPDLQAKFDATAILADIPWIGGREVVRVALGCSP
jgi:hypothetical protein